MSLKIKKLQILNTCGSGLCSVPVSDGVDCD